MKQIEVRVWIHRPAEEVYDYVVDTDPLAGVAQ